jgi:hypothetical protein
MRFSYAWPLDVGDGSFHYGYVSDGGVTAGVVRSTYAHYAEVRGLPAQLPMPSDYGGRSELLVFMREGREYCCVLVRGDAASLPARKTVRLKGRVLLTEMHGSGSLQRLRLDSTASRFHGASIAGLVVGAMGALVFMLYLRAWLRERKAAA